MNKILVIIGLLGLLLAMNESDHWIINIVGLVLMATAVYTHYKKE